MPGRKFSMSTSAVVGELEQRVAAHVGLEVEHDAALAASEQLPRVRVAALGREPTHAPHAVTGGRLDLDHVGTEVGEVPRGAGAGEHRCHVDHPQPVERLHAVRLGGDERGAVP